MTQRKFLDLPVMSNAEVVTLLTRHGVDFAHWPHSMLPPAASAHLQEAANAAFDARQEEHVAGVEDHLVLGEYLESCVSEKPIIRTEWGYLTGDRSPRWVDGTLSLMHTIGVVSYKAGNPTISSGIRSGFADQLRLELKDKTGVNIWPGSDVELCCVVAQCAVTESSLDDELKQIQIVDFLLEILKGNRIEQMICAAIQQEVHGRNAINVLGGGSLPISLQYH